MTSRQNRHHRGPYLGAWLHRIEQLEKFIADHGHLPSRHTDRSLYDWVRRAGQGAIAVSEPHMEHLRKLVDSTPKPERRKSHHSGGGNPHNLHAANTARRTTAAARTTQQARRVLATCSPAHRDVLQCRIDHPDETLAELAQRCGRTKDAYAAALNRALRRTHPPVSSTP